MDISRSLEALYLDGTGMSELPTTSKVSISGYDGFSDMLSLECSRSEENLTFLDTFQMIEAKNAADKVKMCRKLAANYGTRSRIDDTAATSIESFCNMMSLEGAEQAEAAGTDTGNEKAQTPATSEKKRGFFKTIFGAIAKFFKGIAKMFKHMARTIAGWFSRKETDDGPANEVVEAAATGPTNNNAKYKNVRTGGFDPKQGEKNTKKLRNIDLRTLNIAKLQPIATQYETMANNVKNHIPNFPTALDLSNNNQNMNKFLGILGGYGKSVSDIVSKLGINDLKGQLERFNRTNDGNKIVQFEKYYKQAEQQIMNGFKNNNGYESIMKAVYGVSFMDQGKWRDSAERKEQTVKKNELSNFSKIAEKFSNAADVYAEASESLVAIVDKSLSGRVSTTTTTDPSGKQKTTQDWSKNLSKGNAKLSNTESCLRTMAALLKFSSRVGKTIMDGYTRIMNTVNEAKRLRQNITSMTDKFEKK